MVNKLPRSLDPDPPGRLIRPVPRPNVPLTRPRERLGYFVTGLHPRQLDLRHKVEATNTHRHEASLQTTSLRGGPTYHHQTVPRCLAVHLTGTSGSQQSRRRVGCKIPSSVRRRCAEAATKQIPGVIVRAGQPSR